MYMYIYPPTDALICIGGRAVNVVDKEGRRALLARFEVRGALGVWREA
jgi:hypothetical protein